MTRDEMIAKVAEAQYEDARKHRGECEDLPPWTERSGLLGADYMNASQAAVDALWGEVPPWMERHGSWYEGPQVQAWTTSEDHDDAPEITPMFRLLFGGNSDRAEGDAP